MPLFQFSKNDKRLAVLVDPEKFNHASRLIPIIKESTPDYLFIGGSNSLDPIQIDRCIDSLRQELSIPIVIFPGDNNQWTEKADGLLVLSILQSHNAALISGKLMEVADQISEASFETVSTSYVLIHGGKPSSTELYVKVNPIETEDLDQLRSIFSTSNIMNYQATYLEAGSGAYSPVPTNIIALAKKMMPQQIILVGGGIRTESDADKAWQNGADIVVIGNHLETHPEMVKTFCNKRDQINASRN